MRSNLRFFSYCYMKTVSVLIILSNCLLLRNEVPKTHKRHASNTCHLIIFYVIIGHVNNLLSKNDKIFQAVKNS